MFGELGMLGVISDRCGLFFRMGRQLGHLMQPLRWMGEENECQEHVMLSFGGFGDSLLLGFL